LLKQMLPVVFQHPKMDFDSVLININYKKLAKEDIISKVAFLKQKFDTIKMSEKPEAKINWVMGELKNIAIGNIEFSELKQIVEFQ